MSTYACLDIHTTHSYLDSCIKNDDELFLKLKKKGIISAGITDRGNMSGSVKFSFGLEKYNIKPLIGQEFFICNDLSLKDRSLGANYIIKVLAKNDEGFKNLCNLSSLSYSPDNFYAVPRIDFDLLKEYKSGLIILSGTVNGPVGFHIVRKDFDIAKKKLNLLLDNFDDVYFTLGCSKTDKEKSVNNYYAEMSIKRGLPLVLTNDIFYLNKEDQEIQTVLWTIRLHPINKTVKFSDLESINESDEHYIKSYDEMIQSGIDTIDDKYKHLIQPALENTKIIADNIHFKYNKNKSRIPQYAEKSKRKKTINSYKLLEKLCKEWIKKNVKGVNKLKEYNDRLSFELSIIKEKDYSDYFLITKDFIDWCKSQKMILGAGRGSAAGSLITYCLGITNLDPIKHNLKFERFLNIDRIEMPDIDIDIPDDKRQECIDYIESRWSKEKVSHIGTFNSFGIRQAFISAFKSLGKTHIWEEINKNLPKQIKVRDDDEQLMDINDISMPEIIQAYPILESYKNQYPREFKIAEKLLGLYKSSSKHASGIVISRENIKDTFPLFLKKDKQEASIQEDVWITQINMGDCEKLGLVKFDILGLRSLRAKAIILEKIKNNYNKDIKLTEEKHLNDKKIYRLIKDGITGGIFQLDSFVGTKTAQQVSVDSLETMGISVALGRPGPINNGFVDNYERKRHGQEPITYKYPEFEPILKETLGEITYQEQIMEIARVYASYTKSESNEFRKAMGKKIPALMKQQEDKFIDGAVKLKHSKQDAKELFDELAKFAEYGFNASHAKAYAKLSCEMLWLKYNYPKEFYTALLVTETKKKFDSIPGLINECQSYFDIKVLPPDVNKSHYFAHEEDKNIRLGLEHVQGASINAINEIVINSPYSSLSDFLIRTDSSVLDSKSILNLVKSGAFDSIAKNVNRRYLYKYLDLLIKSVKEIKNSNKNILKKINDPSHKKRKNTKQITDINKINYNNLLNTKIKKLVTSHNKYTVKILSGNKKYALANNLEITNKNELSVLKKKISPLNVITDVNADINVLQNVDEWLLNINEKEFSNNQLYAMEKSVMKISFSINPFKEHDKQYNIIKKLRYISDINETKLNDWQEVKVLGLIENITQSFDSKKGKLKARLKISDSSGSADVIVSSNNYESIKDELKLDHVYVFLLKAIPRLGELSRLFLLDKIEKKLN